MIKMTVVAAGITEKEKVLREGDTVNYICHLPGGNVKVRLQDGTVDVAHPLCFDHLREKSHA